MVDKRDMKIFKDHCVFLRSVYLHDQVLFKNSDQEDTAIMTMIMPIFFGDLAVVPNQFLILEVCKITDPPQGQAKKGSQRPDNHTIDFLLDYYKQTLSQCARDRLIPLRDSIHEFRDKILNARHKLFGHSDREAIKAGEPLTNIDQADWDRFWTDLDELVNIMHDEIRGEPVRIKNLSMMTDADTLLDALRYFAEARDPRRSTS